MRKTGSVLGIVVVGLFMVLALASSAVAQQATVTVPLSAQNGSGITGSVTLTDLGNSQTRVDVSIAPATGDHPAHIHMGTCANLDPAPEFPLENVQSGTSTTVVNAALGAIQGTQRAINLHQSAADAATYIACGDIPVVGSQPPTLAGTPTSLNPPPQIPTALPRAGDAPNPTPVLLIAGLVLCVVGVACRRLYGRR